MANWLAFTRAHCAIYRGTRGVIGGSLLGMQMLLLTTKGRKSGIPRTLPLAYVEYKDAFIVVASNASNASNASSASNASKNGGADHPPAWWLNLQATERARIQVGAEAFEVQWSIVPEEERMEYWRALQAAIPAYRAYRTQTDREIPLIRLERWVGNWQTQPLSRKKNKISAAKASLAHA